MKTTIEFTLYDFDEVAEKVKKYINDGYWLIDIITNRIYGEEHCLSVQYNVTLTKNEKD